jgi:serine/threonine-protein kinase
MGTTHTCSSCGDSVSGLLDRCPKDGTPLFSDEVTARVGMVLRDHKIQGVIGEGGMGVVYRAQHVVIEKPVAIKVLFDRFAKQKEMVEQFIIEAKAASRIRHPNIIDVTDFGTTPEGLVFLIMEYLDGESLQERLGQVGRLPVFDAVNIVKQIARGLGAAHELGIVHRDLKPANIFLCQREGRRRIVRRTSGEAGPQFVVEPEDKYDFVKLLDFGVAKILDLGPSAATRAGMFCGTPHYLSPEQAQEQSATQRSDIYSLGAVFYEMVTGSVPFDGSSMFEILKGHVVGDLVLPSRRAPDAGIGVQVDSVIARCLEKEPARRYASTDELCDALSECVGERAFLRDAHRLPGIHESGIDLSDGTSSARREADRPSRPESGFSAAEKDSEWERLADVDVDVDDRPDRRRKRALDRRDTARIPRRRSGSIVLVLVVVVVAGAGALWALRERLGLVKRDAPVATAGGLPAPVAPTKPAPSTATSVAPVQGSPGTATAPALVAPGAVANLGGTKPVPLLAPGKPVEADKAAQARPRPGAGGRRTTPPLPPSIPLPAIPVPPEPVAAAPAPASPSPPPAPAVDVNALLKEAQQAWSRRYYGVAIDKAREVLKASPGRHDAYQIIAVCSCAVGAAEDAREAVSHLDSHKQKLVQSLCKNHGVTLE